MLRPMKVVLGALCVLAVSSAASAVQFDGAKARDPGAVQRLQTTTGAKLALNDATGTVRFARAERGRALAQAGGLKRADHSQSFLRTHGAAFGIKDPGTELKLQGTSTDRLGFSRVNYFQVYRGVPVFGGSLKAHYDAAGNLKAMNGLIVPDLAVNTVPSRTAKQAQDTALALVKGSGVTVRATRLWIFRENLAKGVPGTNHLAFEIEVGNGSTVREFVFIDAHTGAKIDQLTGIHEAMNRRAYNAAGATAPGPTYPATPYWSEGQALPTASAEANNMLYASKETYDLFKNAFGRDSYDGAGKTMDSIFNRGNSCPNASWNGTFISFCPGLTTDDVTGHEWAHAYTEYTHGLIYQWQPGALNESYSDIWGETVDRINNRDQTVRPFTQRLAGQCSLYGGSPPTSFVVNSPALIAGEMIANKAAFGAQTGTITGVVALVADAVAPTGDACSALVGFPAGRIALLDRGVCGFAVKVKNAQNAGAIGVVIANTSTGAFVTPGGADATITIPSVMVSFADGNKLRNNLPANVTMSFPVPTDNSERWLLGEDDNAPGLVGPLRDMWNPNCYNNPGKVTDRQYTCSTADNGGVHGNSGVPNHAFALVVDGGVYNGQTVTGIGLTKAAHIYFRAQTVYQHSASDFADHADSIEQSCTDLTGTNVPDLLTGAASGQVISTADCAEVAKAGLAVQLRTAPTQCNFQPLLAQSPPGQCAVGNRAVGIFASNFETTDTTATSWTVSRSPTNAATFTARDWTITGALPDNRAGRAFFGPDPRIGQCTAISNEAGVLHLYSPEVLVPLTAAGTRLSFDHWVGTEVGYDGGNLSIQVNGGAWTKVASTDFVYNAYNMTLTAASGSDNPLAGQKAFSGTDGGAVDGTWGRSILNIENYAARGSRVRLRFDFGTDCGGGAFGWYVDDVSMYSCKPIRTGL